MTAFDNMRALLASCKLEAVAHKREATMKTVKTTAIVADALKVMGEADVLSLPVVDVETGAFAGVFSVSDALRHLVKELNLERGNHDLTEAEVVGAMSSLGHRTVEKLMHNGDLWYVQGQDPTVMDAVRDMMTDSSVHHRLFVCNSLKDTRPIGILSQSDVVQMMWDHRVEFGALLQSSVEELGLCSAAAETVPAGEPTIRVLLDMYRDRKSCMGITDRIGGELVGNLSASDLRYITPDMYSALMAPVGEFILKRRNQPIPTGSNVDWKAALQNVPVAAITPQTSLEEVLRVLTDRHLHRVYVRNDVEGTIGIITLTDILRPLAPRPSYSPTDGPAGGLPMGEAEAEEMDMEPMQPTVAAA